MSLTSRNLKEIYRDPITILLGLFMPILLLVLFSSLYKNAGVEMFAPHSLVPGIIVFSYAFLMMFIAILMAKDKQSALLIRLFSTPLKPSDYIIGYLLPLLPFALFQTLLCLVLGAIMGASFTHLGMAMLVFFMTATICISFGFIIGALFTINQVSGIGSLMITAISLFSGAWMDLKLIGGVFKSIGYAMPFAHAVDVIRGLLGGKSLTEFTSSFTVIIIYTLVLLIISILSFRRTIKKA